jgi:FtsH-binding integral membrane protein
MATDRNPYSNVATEPVDVASQAEVDERREFIQNTYLHLAFAVLAFVGLEVFLFQVADVERALSEIMLTFAGGWSWLIVLGAFGILGNLAQRLTAKTTSQAVQYGGLGLYVAAQSVLFVPLLTQATYFAGWSVLPTAAMLTLSIFSVLTGYVFVTKQDFSFLGPILSIASIAALVIIVMSIALGFQLGMLFAGVMVVLASGYIVYDTSNVLHHFRTDQHVAAATHLFASLAILFWYILILVMGNE